MNFIRTIASKHWHYTQPSFVTRAVKIINIKRNVSKGHEMLWNTGGKSLTTFMTRADKISYQWEMYRRGSRIPPISSHWISTWLSLSAIGMSLPSSVHCTLYILQVSYNWNWDTTLFLSYSNCMSCLSLRFCNFHTRLPSVFFFRVSAECSCYHKSAPLIAEQVTISKTSHQLVIQFDRRSKPIYQACQVGSNRVTRFN
jgi:hypothetical protein